MSDVRTDPSRDSGAAEPVADALARDALELLEAAACAVSVEGRLDWIDPARAARTLGVAVAPASFVALDDLTAGAATRALDLGMARSGRDVGVEVRADVASALLTVRDIAGGPEGRRRPDEEARALQAALTAQRVRLWRQPIVAANDGAVVRYECLARVLDEQGGVVSPAVFIPAAERAGLVGALDLTALEIALNDLAHDRDLKLAVNVSAGTIADAGACLAYGDRLAAAGDVAPRLTVEITETIAIHDLDSAARFGEAAHQAGARLALDDFGEGYTSFRSLRALPLDEVKIDGLFVERIDSRADSRAFVRAIDGLARDLGLETVAERVETEAEARALIKLGVGGLQGYLYGRPQAA